MDRRTFLIGLPVLLAACSATDVVTGAAKGALGVNDGGLTVDTELQNGDKTVNVGENDNSKTVVDENEGTVSISTNKSDNSFNQAEKVTINNGPDPFMLTLMALGWLLPSPGEMYREIKSWFVPKI